MKSNYYAMLSRMKNIYRWGLMRNTRRESLSEHSYEVALIAHALAVINNERLGGNINPEHCATVALFHDTSEIITGDMPTPVKYHNPEIHSAYKNIEKLAEKSLINMLPRDLQNTFIPLYCPDEQTAKIVKAADRISALIKCIEETDMGNKEFAKAKKSIEKSVRDMNIKEADIFLSEFIDGYSLTLDEQN